MGLDISAYKVERIPTSEIPPEVKPWNQAYDKWQDKRANENLPWALFIGPNANPGGGYWDDHVGGLEPGWYHEAFDEQHSFRAGSYSGHNEFRNQLAKAAGYERGASTAWDLETPYGPPFMELINFSDAEGLIGPTISQKLYNDFLKHEDEIMNTIDQWYLKMVPGQEWDLEEVRWFKRLYEDWKEAFRIASDNGVVSFH